METSRSTLQKASTETAFIIAEEAARSGDGEGRRSETQTAVD